MFLVIARQRRNGNRPLQFSGRDFFCFSGSRGPLTTLSTHAARKPRLSARSLPPNRRCTLATGQRYGFGQICLRICVERPLSREAQIFTTATLTTSGRATSRRLMDRNGSRVVQKKGSPNSGHRTLTVLLMTKSERVPPNAEQVNGSPSPNTLQRVSRNDFEGYSLLSSTHYTYTPYKPTSTTAHWLNFRVAQHRILHCSNDTTVNYEHLLFRTSITLRFFFFLHTSS